MCKISGIVTEADWNAWRPNDFRAYLEVVADAFGPDRLMFGSDWPVALLAGNYRQVYELANDFIQSLGQRYAEPFFGRNAIQFYGLTDQ
jgi:L-fuconolactonase